MELGVRSPRSASPRNETRVTMDFLHPHEGGQKKHSPSLHGLSASDLEMEEMGGPVLPVRLKYNLLMYIL